MNEVKKRDLRAELLAAEQEARNKKRKAEGKPPLPVEGPSGQAGDDDEANKRRKLLQAALEMDKDDDDDDDDDDDVKNKEEGKQNGKDEEDGSVQLNLDICPPFSLTMSSDEDSDDSDDEDDEDETAELLRELEKIKRERAEEKARQEHEQSAAAAASREVEIATGNPLLNLAAALGQNPTGVNTTAPGTFSVKRRWDDGQFLIHRFI